MASELSPPDSGDTPQRRERVAIAAQACQTCRNRKSKCDEQRPKCGLCTRLNAHCQYREPLPTKKDKTMVHILESLTRLENKIDVLGLDAGHGASGSTLARSQRPGYGQPTKPGAVINHEDLHPKFPTELQQSYRHVTIPHKTILWPSIYIHLINSGIQETSDLQYVLEEGTPWFVRLEMKKHQQSLRYNPNLPHFLTNSNSRDPNSSTNVTFPTLTIQQIREQCDAYFNTFNVVFPLLNREVFMNETVAPLLRDGYADGDPNAVLALLVYALGQVAIDGVFDRPLSYVDGQPSGFRGGSVDSPPGIAIFNEARRRVGFVMTQTSLENVQIMLLQATYYEANARHLEFWRSTAAASMAIQVLIKCWSIDWYSRMGDSLKRAYWLCMLNEDFYHLDLDLPRTGIEFLQDDVPLPYLHEAHDTTASIGPLTEDTMQFQYHFLAMIALRKLIATINNTIHQSIGTESSEAYGGPSINMIKDLARQLESWRSLLPRPLQWSDNDRFDFSNTDPTTRRSHEPLFTLDQVSTPVAHKNNLDVVTAQLRTRFYYARFIVYRPFIYKALHFPELMTSEDASYCAMGIRSACLWPICMAPPRNKKRILPHLFAWTQNFMAILLILRMTTENQCLKSICEQHVNTEDIRRTVALLLDWMRDVKQLDGVAEWSWRILEPLYSTRST